MQSEPFNPIMTMKNPVLFFTIVLLLVFSTSVSAQIGLKPYSTFVTGATASALVINDINSDGLKDIAVITHEYWGDNTDYKLLIYYQNSSGNLDSPIVFFYPYYSEGAVSLDAGDLNGDTKTDIALASDDSLVVFYQQNKTTFTTQCTYIGYGTDAVKIGDLNNDGRADLAITEFNATNIHIFYQDAAGNLTMTNYPSVECGYVKLEICDINNDLLNDLLLFSAGGYNHGLYYYLQNANGSLDYAYSSGIGQNGGRGMSIGDLNNDSKPDIAVTSGGNYPAKLELHMQKSQTFGFNDPLNLIAYDIPEPVCIEDMNCDGNNEILIAHHGWHAISCYEQDAQHNYSTYTLFGNIYGNYDMYNMDTGDLNGDGRPDIALASGNLFVHYNDSKPLVSDTLSVRRVTHTETFLIDNQYVTQYTDTLNSFIIKSTDSVYVKYTIGNIQGWERRYELRNGLICNYYVNDTALIDSIYANWIDTLSVETSVFYHFADTLGVYGTKELYLLTDLNLYPNPTDGLLFIESNALLNNLQISVFNASGQKENVSIAENAVRYEIDMSKKPKGLYFVRIIYEGNIIFKKFVLL
jgi:hypothetical protein